MKYEPIKHSLSAIVKKSTTVQIVFYKLIDLLLLRAWHIKKELRSIRKTIGSEARVLDGGMGMGQYDYYMSCLSRQWKIKGVDIQQVHVDDSQQFFNRLGKGEQVQFEVADLTKFKEENSYNLIISVDVMEHIEDDDQVFKNFYDSLRMGGVLLVSTPSDQGGSDVHDNDEHSFIDEHVRDGYNIDDIRKKLSNAGFQKVEAKYSYGKPGQISWRWSMKYPITMLNKSKLFALILPFYYLIVFPFCLILNYFDLHGKHLSGTGLIVKAWK